MNVSTPSQTLMILNATLASLEGGGGWGGGVGADKKNCCIHDMRRSHSVKLFQAWERMTSERQ